MPGERGAREMGRSERAGILLAAGTVRMLADAAAQAGVALPWPLA